jgi:drug/metabolite transporter (DMT)-like permease
MPPQTVTLYTLLAMSAVVIPPFLFSDGSGLFGIALQTEGPQTLVRLGAPLLGLTLVTFFSRLLLFSGIKHLGGMQTALLGLGELLVTLLFAHLWMGESFSLGQWIGVGLLITSLVLVGLETFPARKSSPGGFLSWLRPASRSVAPLTDTWHPNE